MKIKDDNNIMKWWIINDSWLNIINDDEINDNDEWIDNDNKYKYIR